MGEIIRLYPRAPLPQGGRADDPAPEATSVEIEEVTQRLMESVSELIRTLEASHRRIRALIDTIPDADASARLARDHAALAAALRDAKAKAASVGLVKADD